ncbi:MAG: dTDP-4-dehydrorhamnose reductase [Candidatus Oleimmundimicrobium sp.]|nr:dTDP-4-dehydrorhamnose reductase [Candidatus Oleimmundimicrobium sp.]
MTGAKGMFGSDLVKVLSLPACLSVDTAGRQGSEHDVTGLSHQELDVTNKRDVDICINDNKPDVVIHAAAYTDVDGCESNRELAFLVNAEGTKNVASACRAMDSAMVYISTDYVFDGAKDIPHTEEDKPNPINIYGESKLAGENYVKSILDKYYIVRTSWLFGKNGKNFVETILRLAQEKNELKVVNDQVGSPTYTLDLARAIKALLTKPSFGYYHISNQGSCSWYDFAREILGLSGLNDIKVIPVSTEEIKRLANRPKYSVLNCQKFMDESGYNLRNWQDGLKDYLAEKSCKAN